MSGYVKGSHTAGAVVTNSPMALVSGGDSKTLLLLSLFVCNSSASATTITVELVRETVRFLLRNEENVGSKSSVQLDLEGIALGREDALEITAATTNVLHAVIAYEDISR